MIIIGTKKIPAFFLFHIFKVKDIHPEIDGELVPGRLSNLSEAKLYCRKISGTSLVVALVKYRSDVEEPKLHRLDKVSMVFILPPRVL